MMETKVINLWAGPGQGKSTLAAGLFYEMKRRGLLVELVQEAAKDWAWSGRVIKKDDQIAVFAEQFRRESLLYGKVQFLITDSPLPLACFYDNYFHNVNRLFPIAKAARKANPQLDFLLSPRTDYSPEGRFQTRAEALSLHCEIHKFVLCVSDDVVELRKNTVSEALSKLRRKEWL